MPIYAFECASCGHQFERLQRLADADPQQCPVCAAEQVRRQLTAPSFRLAGAGWYETDFKKDGDKKRNLAEKSDSAPSAADAGAQTSGKGDSQSSAPSEPKPAAKVEARSDSKPDPKSDASSKARPEAKPEAKPASKPPTPAA